MDIVATDPVVFVFALVIGFSGLSEAFGLVI